MGQARRIVVPGIPHHVVQRGVRSMDLFSSDSDREMYLALLAECAARYGLSVWSWCLMTNHIHLLAVPATESSLAKGLGETHRRYSRRVNARLNARGHLFEGRFYSYPVEDDANLLSVARYVELNPVMAGLARSPEDYRWSSARHHLKGIADPLVGQSPILDMVTDWNAFLNDGVAFHKERKTIEQHLSTGGPLGSAAWIASLESTVGRPLTPRKRGRKRKKGGIRRHGSVSKRK